MVWIFVNFKNQMVLKRGAIKVRSFLNSDDGILLCRYRSTVIRNLPQLQKLDNAVVQPDDMAEAMRRGVELVHPLERDTAYPPPQSMGYSQVSTGENE